MASKVNSDGAARRDQPERLADPRVPGPPRQLREAGAAYQIARVPPSRARAGRSTDPRRVMLEALRSALGAPLTAALTGIESVAAVNGLIHGRSSFDDDLDRRLRDAFDVTQTLLAIETPDVTQAWLLGMNPMLEDRAPAAVLSEDPAAVLRAARFFVATG